MEKLKQAKHNHLLTDWLKVGIFALLLLLPFFVFAPTAFYYGFNEHATAPTKQVENTTTIHMQQNVINGLPSSTNGFTFNQTVEDLTVSNEGYLYFDFEATGTNLIMSVNANGVVNNEDYILLKFNLKYESPEMWIYMNNDYTIDEDTSYFDSGDNYIRIQFFIEEQTSLTLNTIDFYLLDFDGGFSIKDIELFNLTQMFGSGNEPTIDEFNTLFPNAYYAVDSDATAEWPNGTYTTYTDISSTMSFAWESMFDTPLLKWTKNSPFKTSINGFLTLFQIPQESGIGLYLNYLMTMVCIYVVFDIVIQLFKWLTHIIGEK